MLTNVVKNVMFVTQKHGNHGNIRKLTKVYRSALPATHSTPFQVARNRPLSNRGRSVGFKNGRGEEKIEIK